MVCHCHEAGHPSSRPSALLLLGVLPYGDQPLLLVATARVPGGGFTPVLLLLNGTEQLLLLLLSPGPGVLR
jgi:hypothetical protein